jgi:hypothetical protein
LPFIDAQRTGDAALVDDHRAVHLPDVAGVGFELHDIVDMNQPHLAADAGLDHLDRRGAPARPAMRCATSMPVSPGRAVMLDCRPLHRQS